jgi:hypothetical protein
LTARIDGLNACFDRLTRAILTGRTRDHRRMSHLERRVLRPNGS